MTPVRRDLKVIRGRKARKGLRVIPALRGLPALKVIRGRKARKGLREPLEQGWTARCSH